MQQDGVRANYLHPNPLALYWDGPEAPRGRPRRAGDRGGTGCREIIDRGFSPCRVRHSFWFDARNGRIRAQDQFTTPLADRIIVAAILAVMRFRTGIVIWLLRAPDICRP